MNKGKVLLTGHRGYIGSVMGPRLVKAGYDVVGLDTVYYGEDCSFTNEDDGITDIGLDIRDITSENIQGFDTIIHLAALSNDPLGSLQDKLTYDINHYASVRLAQMAKEAGVSMVGLALDLLTPIVVGGVLLLSHLLKREEW